MYFYLNPKKNSAMPKFMKISEKEKKCQEIMALTDSQLPEIIDNFYDEKPLIKFRKFYFKISSYINRFSLKIVKNPIFDNISLMVILINTLLILISDPVDPLSIANTTDDYFLYFYTFEMILKIFAFGFILPENSYLKDLWNILDFVVIFVGWISFLVEKTTGGGKIQGLAGLRTFRILRPLKTVKSIKGLRRIISTLLESMLALGDILIVLFFFFLIFAVAGVQMWQGNYLLRCQSSIYGYPLDFSQANTMCSSDADCVIYNTPGERFYCVKSYLNPNNNCTHFNDTLTGLITVFITATMEGWTDFWAYTSNTFKDSYGINLAIIFFYFHVLLFVGGYYLINLFLAVILTKFSEVESKINDKKNKIVSLYTILIQTFDKTEQEDGENEEFEGEDEQEKMEDKEAKLKSDTGIFKYKENELPVSYELLSNVLSFKTYTPQELYYIKKNLFREANNALVEYNELLGQHKKSLRERLSLRKKSAVATKSFIEHEKEKFKLKESKTINLKRKHTNLEVETKINKANIPVSLERTWKFFSDAIKNIKNEAEMRIQAKKQKEESTKKKTYIEVLIDKEKMQENKYDKLNESSRSEIDDDDLNSSLIKKNKKAKDALNKKNSLTEDKKTTDEENKKNDNNQISFSMDTSDEDSFSEINIKKSKSIDTINMDSSRSKRKTKEDDEENKARNTFCQNLITKKTLIDEENELYNKMIINKPQNPMFNIMKKKEEKIRKQKIDMLREQFNPDEYISKLKPTLRNKLGRGKSFLNVLKFTDENTEAIKKETVQEIKDYEDLLEEKNSLDISKHKEEPLIIDTQSDINQEDINVKNNEDDKFIDFDKLSKGYEDNRLGRLSRNSNLLNLKMKRNTLAFNNNDILKATQFSQYTDFIEKGYEGPNRINALLQIVNNKIKDDENYLKDNQDKNVNDGNNFNETSNEKINSWRYITNIKNTKSLPQQKIKSFSIKKNGFKFPGIEKNINYDDAPLPPLSDESKKKKSYYSYFAQEQIEEHLTKSRKYMRHINYCLDKDFKILDEFKVDDFIEDVMGKIDIIFEEKIKNNLEINPIKIFNSDKIILKPSSYLKYNEIDSNILDFTEIQNYLRFLNPKIFAKMSENTRNFRLADKIKNKNKQDNNKILILKGDTINQGFLNSFKINEFSSIRSQHENISTVHKTKSLISVSSITNLNKNNLNVMQKLKKDDNSKAFENFVNLDFEKKQSDFFLADKINNKTKEMANRPQIKFEIDSENFDVRNRIKNIRNFDAEINNRKYKDWSAQQVMGWKEDESKYKEWNYLINKIEDTNIILWSKNNFKRMLSYIRYYLFKLSISQKFDFFIIFVVLLNIVLMMIGGDLFDPVLEEQMQVANYGFTAVFIFEFVVKFIGLGPIIYFSDAFTYLDLAIIGFAILDMASPTPSADQVVIVSDNNTNTKSTAIASQLSFLRVFRIFRVTRIAKVLKKIKHFRRVLSGIKKSLSNVSYNLLICFIFLLIFQLLGMNLLNADENFTSFMKSFYITFQVLTMENWNTLYYQLSYTSRLSLLYLVTWIFLGNFVLFNLFISILLSSFEIEEQEDEELPESMPEEFKRLELLDRELKNAKKMKKIKDKTNNKKAVDDKQAKNSDDEGSDEEESKHVDQKVSMSSYKGIKKFKMQRRIINMVFRENECELSLYLFSQTNKFRLWCMDIVTLKKFDNFILLMILLSTLRLIIDTFIAGSLATIIFDMVDIFFTFVFLAEMILKIVSLGFVFGQGTYLKDNWNRIDFIIVCVSIIDLQGILTKYTSGKLSGSSLNFLKVLRLLRTLRPLRFISHNVQLKIIITSLFDSIVPIANVLIIVVVILLVFSIVGINLFYDLYHNCYIPDPTGLTPFITAVSNFTEYVFSSSEEAQRKVINLYF